ncbi:hypothetical protein L9F63_015134, partial [Diploptera punctata]
GIKSMKDHLNIYGNVRDHRYIPAQRGYDYDRTCTRPGNEQRTNQVYVSEDLDRNPARTRECENQIEREGHGLNPRAGIYEPYAQNGGEASS